MRRNQSGMTIVEVMMVVVIIAVLAAVTMVGIGGVIEATKAKGGSEQLAGGIRVARQYAISRAGLYCIEIFPDASGSAYRVREATAVPGPPITYLCNGTVVDPLTPAPNDKTILAHGQALITPLNQVIVFDGLGAVKNFPPGNPSVSLTVDANPSSCPQAPPMEVYVTVYGGVRVRSLTC